jgi:outer membrane receptor protein involved in Fe transport
MLRLHRLSVLLALLVLLCAPAAAAPEDAAQPVPAVTMTETTVTATRTPRSVSSLSGSATVMDRDEIGFKDSVTLDQAMDQVAGVDVVGASRYGQEVRFNTRGLPSGFGTQRTLILLDGRPLTDAYLGSVDLAQYPLGSMQRIELVRGPASALYGSNALGGVGNLIPRAGGPVQQTEIYGEGGTFGSWRTGISHGTMAGPVDVFLSIEGAGTNGYLDNSRGDDMDWATTSAFFNLGYATDRFEVRAYFSAFGGRGTDEDYDRDVKRNMEDLDFTYQLDPEHDAVTNLRVYRSQLDQTLDWFERPKTDYDQVSWGAILTQTWRVHSSHLLLGGLEWRLEDAQVGEPAGDVNEDATTLSAFVQDEWEVTEDMDVVLGGRYDKRTGIDGEFSFRLGGNYRVVPGTTLRAAVGRAFRAPTISDQYLPTTQYFGMTFEGNPDLDPEYLYSAEVGVDQEVVPGVILSVTGFASSFKDFWDFLPDTDGVFRPQNVGKVRILGLETGVVADIGEGFFADAGYTFTDAEYRDFDPNPDVEGNRIDDNVKHRGSLGVSWRHPVGHAIRFGLMVSGDRYTDPENSQDGRLSSFYVAEIQAVGHLAENIDVTLNVQNLFNHRYATRPEFKQPGRAIFGGVRFTF